MYTHKMLAKYVYTYAQSIYITKLQILYMYINFVNFWICIYICICIFYIYIYASY